MTNPAKPCPDCPFSRTVKPGALGGSPPEMFIGQAYGPFILPCHKHCDFDDPEWKGKVISTPQCAGAASFRTHIGMADIMPCALYERGSDPTVFGGPVEFLAHHKSISLDEAREQLQERSPLRLMQDELRKTEARVHKVEEAAALLKSISK